MIPLVFVIGSWIRKIPMSRAYINGATFIPNFLLSIIGGTSIPPVDPPLLITIPSPTPSIIPAHIAASRGSSTRC